MSDATFLPGPWDLGGGCGPINANLPSWALRAADEFHGAQEVDLALAALLTKRSSASLMDLTPMRREQEIVAIIAKEKA